MFVSLDVFLKEERGYFFFNFCGFLEKILLYFDTTFYNYAQAFISAKKYVAKQIFGLIYPVTNLVKGNSPTLTPNATAVAKKYTTF